MSRPHEHDEQDHWHVVFDGSDVLTALNILHVIKDGSRTEGRRGEDQFQYGYVWIRLRDRLIELFGELTLFLNPEHGRHSRLASEMYPQSVRATHNYLKENTDSIPGATSVGYLLRSTDAWGVGSLTSIHKMRLFYEILMSLKEGRLEPETLKHSR